MADRQTVGDIVRVRRMELGWSQSDLAERVGVGQRRISYIEHNKFVDALRSDLLRRLAEALGLRYDDLAVAAGLVSTRNAARALYKLHQMDGRDRDRLAEIHGRLDPLLIRLDGEDIATLERMADTLAAAADLRRAADPRPPDRPAPSSPGNTAPDPGPTLPSESGCGR